MEKVAPIASVANSYLDLGFSTKVPDRLRL